MVIQPAGRERERGSADAGDFRAFFSRTEPILRRALVAAYGPSGRDAAADALGYAYEHWARVSSMENPLGYLYRVGQSRMRWYRRRPPVPRWRHADATHDRWYEPGLESALRELSQPQRVAVVLCHGFGLTHREVGELLGISRATVQNHVERGLDKLRERLEVAADA